MLNEPSGESFVDCTGLWIVFLSQSIEKSESDGEDVKLEDFIMLL